MDSDMRALPDEQLWRMAVDGDGDAFGLVFDRHADRVLTQCVRRLGARQDADLLASEVFVQAWKTGRGVRFVGGSVLPWLLVVANNLARRHVRSQARYEALRRRAPVDGPLGDPADDAVNKIESGRRAAELARAIGHLSKRHQEVVALCDLGELSYANAAAALNIPVGTVRSRLSRAHAKLRDFLDAESSDRPSRGRPTDTIGVNR